MCYILVKLCQVHQWSCLCGSFSSCPLIWENLSIAVFLQGSLELLSNKLSQVWKLNRNVYKFKLLIWHLLLSYVLGCLFLCLVFYPKVKKCLKAVSLQGWRLMYIFSVVSTKFVEFICYVCIDVIFILTICSYWYQIRHAAEEARTKNATATLNMLLKNYDKRLRPKFGGKPSNFIFC